MSGKAVTELKPAQRRSAMFLLFGIVLLIMIGFSVLFPVEPYYVKQFGADAGTMGWITAIYSLMQFIFAPLWGRLSDRIGRRPVLMIGLLGYIIGQTFFGLATSLWMLFAARAIAGMLSAAALPTAQAYMADITPPEERARAMGITGAAFGLGVIIGPAMGGILGNIRLALPFFVSAGLATIALIGVIFLLPESLSMAVREAAANKPAQSRWAAFTWETAALYAVTFVLSLGQSGMEVTFGFLAGERLHLNPNQTGLVFMVMGVVATFVQGFLVGKAQKKIGESWMTIVGMAVGAIGMYALAVGSTTLAATLAICVLAIGTSLARPANSALISRRAKVGQGVAIGLMGSFDSLGRIGGPILGGYLYKQGMSLPYVSGGSLFLLALVIAATWARSAGTLARPVQVKEAPEAH